MTSSKGTEIESRAVHRQPYADFFAHVRKRCHVLHRSHFQLADPAKSLGLEHLAYSLRLEILAFGEDRFMEIF
jgi:hypothetical protein